MKNWKGQGANYMDKVMEVREPWEWIKHVKRQIASMPIHKFMQPRRQAVVDRGLHADAEL